MRFWPRLAFPRPALMHASCIHRPHTAHRSLFSETDHRPSTIDHGLWAMGYGLWANLVPVDASFHKPVLVLYLYSSQTLVIQLHAVDYTQCTGNMSETIAMKTRSPRLYLVICNIQKLTNVKSLMNTAFAFGCLQVWVVGQSNNSQNSRWIPQQFQEALDQHQIELLRFPKWNDCLEHMKNHDRNIRLVGVEIDSNSQVLNDMDVIPPFISKHEDWAILMGNEGQGIHPRHLEACQGRLIRIPQYGTGTASFNVNVACNIVLYHFHQWKYRQFFQEVEDGEK